MQSARGAVKPKRQESVPQEYLFRLRLENLIDSRHERVRLAALIDWPVFEREFGAIHAEGPGQPPLPTRLMAGLTYLKHGFALSDEEVVARWCETRSGSTSVAKCSSVTNCRAIRRVWRAGANGWVKRAANSY